ncbi:MAG: hypothetical protein Q9178_007107 [Gyalolechia marmorata]
MSSAHPYHISGTQTPLKPLQQGRDNGYAKWPPIVERVDNLGYVEARNQHFYSHDIGRSSELGGRVYYLNGDTMCNDAGVSSNTYQVVPDRKKPTEALYLSTDCDGFVTPLIDKNEEEAQYLSLPGNKTKRIAFWCFGGIVEISPGLGWVWYQKFIINELDGSLELVGVGLARVSQDKNGLAGQLSSVRMPGLMFQVDEPLFGSFSTLVDGNTVYLWGQMGPDVFLACVPKANCQHRHMYQYWNGSKYVPQLAEAVPVLRDYQQGQFFRSEIFGAHLPWLFIGCTRWADSQVVIGAAARLEGPWDTHAIHLATGIRDPVNYRYCMYPHPWATNMTKGKLLVTWCDRWPGGVIAAKIHFATVGSTHWGEIPLDGYSNRVINTAISKAFEICQGNGLTYDELVDPHRLSIRGIDQRGVELAVNMIRNSIAIAEKEEMMEMDATVAEAPRPGFGERIFTKILRHACG